MIRRCSPSQGCMPEKRSQSSWTPTDDCPAPDRVADCVAICSSRCSALTLREGRARARTERSKAAVLQSVRCQKGQIRINCVKRLLRKQGGSECLHSPKGHAPRHGDSLIVAHAWEMLVQHGFGAHVGEKIS